MCRKLFIKTSARCRRVRVSHRAPHLHYITRRYRISLSDRRPVRSVELNVFNGWRQVGQNHGLEGDRHFLRCRRIRRRCTRNRVPGQLTPNIKKSTVALAVSSYAWDRKGLASTGKSNRVGARTISNYHILVLNERTVKYFTQVTIICTTNNFLAAAREIVAVGAWPSRLIKPKLHAVHSVEVISVYQLEKKRGLQKRSARPTR